MYDTVELLLKHVKNNNGKVGIAGISYPGFYTSASIIDSHPAIKAASPQAPMTNLFFDDDGYHGGAFMLSANYGFYGFFHPQKNPTLPEKPQRAYDFGTQDSTNTTCRPVRRRIWTSRSMGQTFCFMISWFIRLTTITGRSATCRGT